MVEHNLAKVGVVSSNLIARSKFSRSNKNTCAVSAAPSGTLGGGWGSQPPQRHSTQAPLGQPDRAPDFQDWVSGVRVPPGAPISPHMVWFLVCPNNILTANARLARVVIVPCTTIASREMARKPNKEVTSARAASAAARVLRDPKSTKPQKTAAASALTQRPNKSRKGK